MTDNLTPSQRKNTMRRVRSKDTKPEMVVRRLVHGLGYRYRLHRRDLPGNPDIVFSRLNKVIFVHGCFWHGHDCKAGLNRPASNKAYWIPKLERNKARDEKNLQELADKGWQSLIIWECQTKDKDQLAKTIIEFLGERL